MGRPKKSYTDSDYYYRPLKNNHDHRSLDQVAEIIGGSRQSVYTGETVGMVKLIEGLMSKKELQDFYSNNLLDLLTAFCSTTSIPHAVAGKAVATILKRRPQWKRVWHLEDNQ